MPATPTLTYAANTVTSWTVAAAFEARLIAGLSDPAQGSIAKPSSGYVRWITPPQEDQSVALKAEEGINLVLGDPQPTTLDGAGRAGKRVRRVVQVWIVTRSNQDRSNDQRIALQKHLTLEDLVFDTLDDTVPDGTATGQATQVGTTLHWIPGGDEIRKKIKIAPDTFVSVHLFEIKYPQRLRLTRTVFS